MNSRSLRSGKGKETIRSVFGFLHSSRGHDFADLLQRQARIKSRPLRGASMGGKVGTNRFFSRRARLARHRDITFASNNRYDQVGRLAGAISPAAGTWAALRMGPWFGNAHPPRPFVKYEDFFTLIRWPGEQEHETQLFRDHCDHCAYILSSVRENSRRSQQ
jgi:hypothetical protein